MKILKKQNGFTIIEFLIYIGIFSILITLLTNVFFSILDSQEESEATSAVDENGRYILGRFIYDISRAQSILTPTTIGTQNNSLQLQINNINYRYSLDTGGNLQITDTTDAIGPDNLNGYDATISALSFQRIGKSNGDNTVLVSFTVNSRTQLEKGSDTRTFQTTIGTRCKVGNC